MFAGLEQIQTGLRYRFEDRAKALESLAQHLQFYQVRDRQVDRDLAGRNGRRRSYPGHAAAQGSRRRVLGHSIVRVASDFHGVRAILDSLAQPKQ